jgi:ABC-type spermidine/putrescine transport system permease subunit I
MKKENQNKRKYWIGLFISLSVPFLFFLVLNILRDEYSEWVTNNWSLSSKEDLFLFTLLQTFTIFILVLSAICGLNLAYWMMKSRHRRKWFALFFLVLGLLGFFSYFQFVPIEERIEFIHIPIIASLSLVMSLGALFFKKEKTQTNT